MGEKSKMHFVFIVFGLLYQHCHLVYSLDVRFPDQDLPDSGSDASQIVFSEKSGLTQLSELDRLSSKDSNQSQSEQVEIQEKSQFSGQLIRLQGGNDQHAGYLQLFVEGQWHMVCDFNDSSWGIPEANVICRQLGYDHGALHIDHGSGVTFANISKAETEIYITKGINCRGEESDIRFCHISEDETASECSTSEYGVGIVCSHPSLALCSGSGVPFKRRCYEIVNEPKSFAEAQADCQVKSPDGGRIVEVRDQILNNFVTELLLHKSTDISKVWTGGVVGTMAGKTFSAWYDSQDKIQFTNYIEGQPEIGKIVNGENHVDDASLQTSFGIQLVSVDRGYFYWNLTSDFEDKSAYICESPQGDIGCYSENLGSDYNGTASKSQSGLQCLPWNTPGLVRIFEEQESWDHNFCRNPRGVEEGPLCYVDEHNYDYCQIPRCGESSKRRDTASNILPDICNNLDRPYEDYGDNVLSFNTEDSLSCSSEQFQCKPGECIFSNLVCDGEKDCVDGEDEIGCLNYLQMFAKEPGFKLQNKETIIRDMSLQECAKSCVQLKNCACTSFSHHPRKNRCIITNSNSNVAPFDALIERKSWNYYKLNISQSTWCKRVKRPAASHIEAIRLMNGREADLVEVKINGNWGGICDDGFSLNEANVTCKHLGFELGVDQVINGQGQNPEDFPILHDIECKGHESLITECEFVDHASHRHECSGTEKAGLRCRKTSKACDQSEWHCKNRECVHVNSLCDDIPHCQDESDEDPAQCSIPLEVRLVGGTSSDYGRIEVRHKGLWGTVCDDHFGANEASVFCKMLGYDGSDASVYNGTKNFSGSGPIWIRLDENDICTGAEGSIQDCKDKVLWTHDHHCTHSEDVAIICGSGTEVLEDSSSADSDSPISENAERVGFLSNLLTIVDESCGIREEETDIMPRISGGYSSSPGKNPWQASIRVQGLNDTYHWCGASIITRFKVVTAAHCLKEFPLEAYLVRVGDYSLDILEISEKEYKIEKIDFHEQYNVGPYLNNDIAIATVSRESGGFTYSRWVKPICLPAPKLLPKHFSNLTISGWGKIGFEGFSTSLERKPNDLQEAQVPYVDTAICTQEKVYGPDRLSVGMFCAGDLNGKGADACQGDSGGPAVGILQERATLLGIISWGYGCGKPNKPGVYTQVTNYVSWIQKKLQS